MIKNDDKFAKGWKDIVFSLLKLGVMSYGGPAIMGIMQAELQEKRQWVTKSSFVEGLSLVQMLPGAGATQLGIFWVRPRRLVGWVIGGLVLRLACPAYHAGPDDGLFAAWATPVMRGALYGLGPVARVFVVAVYRLGKSTVGTIPQMLIAVAAVVGSAFSQSGSRASCYWRAASDSSSSTRENGDNRSSSINSNCRCAALHRRVATDGSSHCG